MTIHTIQDEQIIEQPVDLTTLTKRSSPFLQTLELYFYPNLILILIFIQTLEAHNCKSTVEKIQTLEHTIHSPVSPLSVTHKKLIFQHIFISCCQKTKPITAMTPTEPIYYGVSLCYSVSQYLVLLC